MNAGAALYALSRWDDAHDTFLRALDACGRLERVHGVDFNRTLRPMIQTNLAQLCTQRGQPGETIAWSQRALAAMGAAVGDLRRAKQGGYPTPSALSGTHTCRAWASLSPLNEALSNGALSGACLQA